MNVSQNSSAAAQPSPNRFPDEYYADPIGRKRYVVQEKILHEWLAPSKVDMARTKQEVAQLVLGAVIIGLIFLLFQEVAVMIVWFAACVMFFIAVFTPPTYIKCQITTLGIKVGTKYYYWEEMIQFWFEERQNMKLLVFRLIWPIDQNIKLLFPTQEEEKILRHTGKFVLFKKPQPTQISRLKEAVQRVLPPELEWN